MVKKWLAGAAVSGVILCASTGMNAQTVHADELDLSAVPAAAAEETVVVDVEETTDSASENENTPVSAEISETADDQDEVSEAIPSETEAEEIVNEASDNTQDTSDSENAEVIEAEASESSGAGEAENADTVDDAVSADTAGSDSVDITGETANEVLNDTEMNQSEANEAETAANAEAVTEAEADDAETEADISESGYTTLSVIDLLDQSSVLVSTDANLNVRLKAAVLTALTSTTDTSTSLLDELSTSEIKLSDDDLAYGKLMENYTIDGEYWSQYNVWMQGATSVGSDRFVFALVNLEDDNKKTLLYEYNRVTDKLTLKKSDTSYGHCNNIAYDSKNHELLILMDDDPDGRQQIAVLDADTFTEKNTKYLTYANSGGWMAYDEDHDYYLVRDSSSVMVLDSSLNHLKSISAPFYSKINSEYSGVIQPQALTYGNGYVFVGDGIYEGSDDKNDWYTNIIRMYSLSSGELLETYLVDDVRGEIEALSFDGTNLVISYMTGPKMPGFDTNKFGSGRYVAQFYAVALSKLLDGTSIEKTTEQLKKETEQQKIETEQLKKEQEAKEASIASNYGITNLSLIYDYDYYVKKYSNLLSNISSDRTAVLEYFLSTGMKAQHQAVSGFDPVSYRYAYQDLRRAYGTDYAKYYQHYIKYGYKEKRTSTSGVTKLQNPVTVQNGINYSLVYDYFYYTDRYADVKKAFGEDDFAVLDNFVKEGMKNQRQAISSFDEKSYRYAYQDLRRAYGTDYSKYYLHYIKYGYKEKRTSTTGVTTIQNPVTAQNGIDYSKVYNYSYYSARYADLVRAYGDNDVAYMAHFVKYGMSERRQAISTFNVDAYRSAYADLRRAYGSNYSAYYLHYIKYGYNENRTLTTQAALDAASKQSSNTATNTATAAPTSTRSNLASILANPIIPDISHWKPVKDWDWVENNVAFLITKATQGTSYVDATLKDFVKECEARNIPYWLYTFLDDGNELAQAQFLVKTCSSLVGKNFMGYVLDVEDGNSASNVSSAINYLNTQSSRTMIYTGWSYYQYKSEYKTLLNNRSENTAWWESRYGKDDGNYPDQSKYPIHKGVDLHQYTSAGYTKGISSATDLNKVVGSKSLKWFMGLE